MAPGPDNEAARAQHALDVDRFISLLLGAADDLRARTHVVMTVRADFYGPLMRHAVLATLLPRQQVNIGSMNLDDVRAAVVKPAEVVGLSFEPAALVEEILADVGTDEGMLPLLQYALKETWVHRKGTKLTADGYTATGGVSGAIRETAKRIYASLTQEEQNAARRVFLRLVTPGEGREDTRARSVMPDDPVQRRVVERFADPNLRLLVTGSEALPLLVGSIAPADATPPGGGVRATVDVAHEALIRTWPQLRSWWTPTVRSCVRARSYYSRNASGRRRGRTSNTCYLPAFNWNAAGRCWPIQATSRSTTSRNTLSAPSREKTNAARTKRKRPSNSSVESQTPNDRRRNWT